jgi:hypothetical protein
MRADHSIPRPISEAAKRLARKLGMSPSELYTAALTAYLASHPGSEVTEMLNRVYERESSTVDPVLAKMQFASLGGETW